MTSTINILSREDTFAALDEMVGKTVRLCTKTELSASVVDGLPTGPDPDADRDRGQEEWRYYSVSAGSACLFGSAIDYGSWITVMDGDGVRALELFSDPDFYPGGVAFIHVLPDVQS